MENISGKHIVLFDLGDTLIFFNGDWQEVLRRSTKRLWKSLLKAGFPLDFEEFSKDFSKRMEKYYIGRNKDFVEYTSARVLSDYLDDLGYSQLPDQLIVDAMNAMYSVSQEFWQLEEDTIPILKWLQNNNFRIGLISNASDTNDVYSLLNQFRLTNFFEHIVISAEFGLRKPHKDIFFHCLDLFNSTPQSCSMVGDRMDMDILGAKNAGISSIWISRRSIHKEVKKRFDFEPDFEISSLKELKEILC